MILSYLFILLTRIGPMIWYVSFRTVRNKVANKHQIKFERILTYPCFYIYVIFEMTLSHLFLIFYGTLF